MTTRTNIPQVFSNFKFCIIAGGGRHKATAVALFIFAFFFVSSSLLSYIPTVLASTLILVLGIQLLIDAL
jgi:MFS superfamily sulfate permease-like transporter